MIPDLLGLVLHLDTYLNTAVQQYGIWIYAILFLIIFIETGIVFAPFLPGDSLLFVAGALAVTGSINLVLLMLLLMAAAILGDTANYWIGHHTGRRIVRSRSRLLNKDHLKQAESFYERHGGKTIIIARFIPFIRTFAPFVAGLGKMRYPRFLTYNIIGGVLWVAVFMLAGYFFGNLPIVRDNFGLFVVAIIVVTVAAAVAGLLRERKNGKK
jgi:membrane-associated protein